MRKDGYVRVISGIHEGKYGILNKANSGRFEVSYYIHSFIHSFVITIAVVVITIAVVVITIAVVVIIL